MNSKDLHNLSEAWNNITSSQQIDEALPGGMMDRAIQDGEKRRTAGYTPLDFSGLLKSLGITPQMSRAQQRGAAQQQLVQRLADKGITYNSNRTPVRTGGDGGGGGSRPQAPVLTPQQIARQKANAEYQALRTKDPAAAKAAGDKAFATFNPKLAAAAAERARIRGTAQTDNPLMRDMRSRLPQVTPSIQAPAVARLGAGNQSLVQNRNAIRGAAPKPVAPVAATAPITNRVATSYGSGAKPIVPIKPIQPVRPLPVARPVASTAYRPGLRLQHTDLFDIVKGHLMNEGATEKEALHMMANMNDEQREQINEKLIKLGKLSGRLAQKVMNRRAGDLLVGRAPKVRGYISKSIRSLDPDNITPARMSNVPGKVSGQGMGVRPMTLGPKPKAPLDPETRYKLIPGAKYGDTVMAAPGGKPPSSEYPRKIDLTDVKPLPGSKSKLLSQDELDKIRQRALEVGKKSKNKK